jgi:hypothetical protein
LSRLRPGSAVRSDERLPLSFVTSAVQLPAQRFHRCIQSTGTVALGPWIALSLSQLFCRIPVL